MNVLVCNAGSTSLKFKLFRMEDEAPLAEARVERVGQEGAIFYYKNLLSGREFFLENQSVPTYTAGIRLFLDYLSDSAAGVIKHVAQIDRVGFKTVLAKGYDSVHELTAPVIQAMEEMMCVAPAHNGPYLEAIGEFKTILPHTPMIGAFETAFHTTIPLERRLYGIPFEWYQTYGIQRMGYHGASHSYIAETIARAYGPGQKVISCHLGGSCSLCAIEDGKSVDTSFGFSLQTGVLHANRTGDLDPYIYPYLLKQGMSLEEISYGLDKQGGLLGISGISNDLRKIMEQMHHPRARLAFDCFCHDIIKYTGSFYAELGGLDHLVFTGGIGEHSAPVREHVCSQLAHLGIRLNKEKNLAPEPDSILSDSGSPVTVHIIKANEELGVARKTASLPLSSRV